jgi:hypothetical protein
MGKKFLEEGADFLDAAVDMEDSKNRIYSKVSGIPLAESTLSNLINLQNIAENSIVIGKALCDTYNQESFDALIKGLKDGYSKGKDIEVFEDAEKERLGKLFEDHFKK